MPFLRLDALLFVFLTPGDACAGQSMHDSGQQATCNPSGATCALSASLQSPAAGDLYIFGLINRDTNGRRFFSDRNADRRELLTIAPGCSGSFGSGGTFHVGSCYYILPSTSTGYTTTTPTVSA